MSQKCRKVPPKITIIMHNMHPYEEHEKVMIPLDDSAKSPPLAFPLPTSPKHNLLPGLWQGEAQDGSSLPGFAAPYLM